MSRVVVTHFSDLRRQCGDRIALEVIQRQERWRYLLAHCCPELFCGDPED